MGRRSNFARIDNDAYDTPPEAVEPLLPHLCEPHWFADLSAGDGALIRHLEAAGHLCMAAYDFEPRAKTVKQANMMNLTPADLLNAGVVIMNPPWKRAILHMMITHLIEVLKTPSWLLIDANWMFTQQAAPFLPYCSAIVTIGRVRWIPGSDMTGKDDCAWFRFQPEKASGTFFHGKRIKT